MPDSLIMDLMDLLVETNLIKELFWNVCIFESWKEPEDYTPQGRREGVIGVGARNYWFRGTRLGPCRPCTGWTKKSVNIWPLFHCNKSQILTLFWSTRYDYEMSWKFENLYKKFQLFLYRYSLQIRVSNTLPMIPSYWWDHALLRSAMNDIQRILVIKRFQSIVLTHPEPYNHTLKIDLSDNK